MLSKPATNSKVKRVQYRINKEMNPKEFETMEFIERVYKCSNRSTSIKLALRDFTNLFKMFDVDSFQDLLKKIKVQLTE